jgi:hypothetical protein
MAATPEHIREFDPNAKPVEPTAPPAPPVRTPSIVLGEFFRAIVEHLGDHPKLMKLLLEFEELTKAPEIPEPPAPQPEPEV